MSQPDLFVVCKNCGSEVSPYVTECPYCGQRVRKRAPKLDRGEEPESAPRRRRRPSRRRRRDSEMDGLALDARPWTTIVLIAVSAVATLVWASGAVDLEEMGAIIGPVGDEWWRVATTPFLHDNAGYQFIALVAVGIFGSSLERRFGHAVPLLVFLAAGAGGAALSEVASVHPVWGANGAALGLYSAWLVDDRLALRRGDDRETDMIGAWVAGAVLALLSVAWEPASIAAAVGGAAVGALAGALLSSRGGR